MNAFLRRRGVHAVVFAVVVAALLYVSRDDGSHPALPKYALPQGGLVLTPGPPETFELVVRPTAHPPTKVVAYVFAMEDGEPNAADAKVVVAPQGEVRITGRTRALAGARELRVVLGAATDFKRFEDALSRAREGTGNEHVRVVVVPIVRGAR
jgi:hypothetical protein